MRTTTKELNDLVKQLADLTGMSNTREAAIKAGQDKYLLLENAPIYGGWRLVSIGVKNGAHYGAFGGNGCESRLKAYEMAIKLRALIAGLTYRLTEEA
jgi:hypothetical protein